MAQPQVVYSTEARADLLALETYIAAHDGRAPGGGVGAVSAD